MSDVSKTNELIEETRSRHKGAGMSDRFKFCLHCEDEWPCDASRLADALEAAPRIPVQGEPNGDREALRDEFRSYLGDEIYVCSRDHSAWSHGTMGLDDFSLAAEDDEIVESLVQIASRSSVPDAALAEAKKQLGEIQRHFTAIAGSGEIRVYEDTGEKHGIDYQSSVWAKRGERMTRDLIEFLGEHHRPEPVGNGESK